MHRVALFAFNGEPMCFSHFLLTALDMKERGFAVRLVIEGQATKLIPEISVEGNPLFPLYEKVKNLGLIDGACKACSNKTGAIEAMQKEGIKLLDEMSGHPSMGRYHANDFTVITF